MPIRYAVANGAIRHIEFDHITARCHVFCTQSPVFAAWRGCGLGRCRCCLHSTAGGVQLSRRCGEGQAVQVEAAEIRIASHKAAFYLNWSDEIFALQSGSLSHASTRTPATSRSSESSVTPHIRKVAIVMGEILNKGVVIFRCSSWKKLVTSRFL
jgi:hypothetical protein